MAERDSDSRASVSRFLRGLGHDWSRLVATTEPFTWRLVIGFALFQVGLMSWDQPGFYGWENDGAAPRGFFQGIADNLMPGHAHRYPLFHYLLIGLLCTPVLLIDLIIAAVSDSSVTDIVVSTPSMSAIALLTKLLHLGMTCVGLLAAARIWSTLFDRHTARWALLFTVTNLTVAYYGRVTNVDAAYLMWVVLAVDRMLLLLRRDVFHHYAALALFVAAALATKDQAYASFVFSAPLYLIVLPLAARSWRAATRRHWARLGWAALLTLAFYAVLSGALFNPTGFVARIDLLAGPNSQDWRQYPRSLVGLIDNARDLVRFQDEFFWPTPVVILAWLGALAAPATAVRLGGSVALDERRARRWLAWLPLVVGLSSIAAFTLVVGRAEHRFMLVMGYWLGGYAGVLVASMLHAARSLASRRLALALAGVLLGLAVSQNVELAVTQLLDPRRDVERFLARLPPGAQVETYGLGVYLPRFDLRSQRYSTTRVSAQAWGPPPPIVGLREVHDDFMNYDRRGADVLIVPEGFLNRFRPRDGRATGGAMNRYRKAPGASSFFSRVLADALPGYRRIAVGTLQRPAWYAKLGGRFLQVHGSTGRAVWVLVRERPPRPSLVPRGGDTPGRPLRIARTRRIMPPSCD